MFGMCSPLPLTGLWTLMQGIKGLALHPKTAQNPAGQLETRLEISAGTCISWQVPERSFTRWIPLPPATPSILVRVVHGSKKTFVSRPLALTH